MVEKSCIIAYFNSGITYRVGDWYSLNDMCIYVFINVFRAYICRRFYASSVWWEESNRIEFAGQWLLPGRWSI